MCVAGVGGGDVHVVCEKMLGRERDSFRESLVDVAIQIV